MKTVIAAALLLSSLPALAGGNPQAGQQKAASCQGCHGAAGKAAVSLYPNLAGQNADYLEHALHAYKKGDRSNGQAEAMKAFVAGLSDEDMADLAAYYAGLKP